MPNTPKWMNKFVATLKPGADLEIALSGKIPFSTGFLKNMRWSVNMTNLADRKGVLQPNVGQASGSYATYPIPPRKGFFTLRADI